ncbi:MAG: NIPSNAP family protein [Maribacter sp.]|nr:NIPSNAP family protein [Maribacter sp.]
MKTTFLTCLLVIAHIWGFSQGSSNTKNREYYQLKVYSFASDSQIATTDAYLKNAFLPALKRTGISHVGVFKPRPLDSLTPKKTYVLIPFANFEQFESLADLLDQDTAYLEAGKEYLTAAHNQPPYERISSTLLKAFPEMPKMMPSALKGNRADRVYELRSYESATEALNLKKVEMFNAGGEVPLFARLGFNAVFYAEVLSGAQMPNLMYLTTFKDQESRDELWKAFFDSPEWTKLKDIPKYQNTVSHNEQLFLYPTDYSDY